MKKVAVLLSILILGATSLNAQNYQQAIGLKFGYTQSIEYKLFTTPQNFIDAGLQLNSIGHFGLSCYGFYNISKPINGNNKVSWYHGPGATIGYGGLYGNFNVSANYQIGVEFLFDNAPIALSLDWAPGLGVGFYPDKVSMHFSPSHGGLCLKYVF